MVNHGVGQLTTRHADPFGHTPRHRRPVFERSAACRRCSVMVERTSAHTHQNSGASGRRFQLTHTLVERRSLAPFAFLGR